VAYDTQSKPVIAWYEKNGGPVIRIDAMGTTDEVFGRVQRELREQGAN
jgi:adenylate kinase family enzyme